MHPVKPAGQCAVLPDLDRVAMTECKQLAIEAPDAFVDPGRAPAQTGRCAAVDHRLEIPIDPDLEAAIADGADKPPRNMHPVERKNAAPLRLDPIKSVVLRALGHGKDAAGIGFEKHLRRDLDGDIVD